MATVIRTATHTAPAMATLPTAPTTVIPRTVLDTATVIPRTVLDTAPTTVIPRTILDTVLGIPTDPTVLDTATPTMVIDTHIPTTARHTGTIVRGDAVGGSRPSTAGIFGGNMIPRSEFAVAGLLLVASLLIPRRMLDTTGAK